MTGARLYFTSIDTDGKGNLWVTDGTAAGTKPVSTANSGGAGLYPSSFTALGNSVYFQGFDAETKPNLFTLDGASSTVSEITPANISTSVCVDP